MYVCVYLSLSLSLLYIYIYTHVYIHILYVYTHIVRMTKIFKYGLGSPGAPAAEGDDISLCLSLSLSLYIYIYIYMYLFMYIYIYRERERLACAWSPLVKPSTSDMCSFGTGESMNAAEEARNFGTCVVNLSSAVRSSVGAASYREISRSYIHWIIHSSPLDHTSSYHDTTGSYIRRRHGPSRHHRGEFVLG